MSLTADEIVTELEADTNGSTGVADYLTGGIYTYEETGRLGIGRKSTPNAYDSTTGLMKPCCVVKLRDQVPDGGMVDPVDVSFRQVAELWFYDDGGSATTAIVSARTRAFTVLNEHMLGTDYNVLLWAGNFLENQRDPALDYAHVRRSEYALRALM